jgi:hypothetical protein
MQKLILLLLLCSGALAQVDTQTRFTSDSRQYYVWSDTSQSYVLRDSEFEHSVIDIRELGSKSNGYIAISMVDDGKARLFHGSITGYTVSEKKEPTWQIRSKILKAKLTLNPVDHTFTFVYDANEQRYQRILVFSLNPEPPSATKND